MAVTLNTLREKLRKKELYIVAGIGSLIILIFGSGVGTISIDGVAITEYSMLIPFLLTIVNAVCGILAIVLSIRTIPNEYERSTSHLIWIRGISQARYHGELALANVISSMAAAGIMYLGIAVFTILKGEITRLPSLLPSYLILCISVAMVSLVTSILTIKCNTMAAGFLAVLFYLSGILHGVLDVAKNLVEGFVQTILGTILAVVPDLQELQTQAANLIGGKGVNIHSIVSGLFVIYLLTLMFFILKRKEA